MTKKSTRRAVGAGLAAAGAAAAAGYYFFASKKGKEHRHKAVKWANDMKREVVRQTKGLKDMTADDFGKAVETVVGTYRGLKKIDPTEVHRAARELKANWQKFRDEMQSAKRTGISRARAVKKRVRGLSRKSAKKS